MSGARNLKISTSATPANGSLLKFDLTDWQGDAASSADINLLAFPAATQLTASGGAITPTQAHHTVEGESGASDDLTTITGTAVRVLFLRPAVGAHVITIKSGSDNILTHDGNDYAIPANGFVILLFNGTDWLVLHP